MHFTNLASDIRRFGVTLGLVGVTLGFLMTSAAMNLAAGILVFLAALIPIVARLWRSASQKGRHRSFLSLTAAIVGLFFFIVADIGWLTGMHLGLVVLFQLINATLVVIGFAVDDSPMGRPSIVAFTMSMSGAVAFLVIIAGLKLAQDAVDKSQATLLREIRSTSTVSTAATPAPAPSATPHN